MVDVEVIWEDCLVPAKWPLHEGSHRKGWPGSSYLCQDRYWNIK